MTNPTDWDALCLQEVPASIDKLASFQSPSWHLILPHHDSNNTNDKHIRSAIYLNRNISSSQYQQLQTHSLDITAIHQEKLVS
jgi:hypothetical protein